MDSNMFPNWQAPQTDSVAKKPTSNYITPPTTTAAPPPAGSPPPTGTPPATPPPAPAPLAPTGPSNRKSILKWTLLGLGILIILLLVGAYIVIGRGLTPLGSKFQDHMWVKLMHQKSETKASHALSYKYEDPEHYEFIPSKWLNEILKQPLGEDLLGQQDEAQVQKWDEQYSFTLDKLSVAANLNGYLDSATPLLDGSANFQLQNNSQNYALDMAAKLTEQALFIKYMVKPDVIESIQKLDDVGQDEDVDQLKEFNDKWLRFNLEDETYKEFKDSFNQAKSCLEGQDCEVTGEENQARKILELIEKNRFLKIKSSTVGFHHGTPVIKYNLSYDKEKLKHIAREVIKLTSEGAISEESDLKDMEELITIIFDKMEVSETEIWMGMFDGKTYKTASKVNYISLAGFLTQLEGDVFSGKLWEALGNNTGYYSPVTDDDLTMTISRDARRMSDIRQLASALELYYNDNNRYPSSDGQGHPIGLSPTYLGQIPEAPSPTDGGCSDYYNPYWYEYVNESQYTYTFCIGSDTGGYNAGLHKLTPAGIERIDNCAEADKCYDSSKTVSSTGDPSASPNGSEEDLVFSYIKDFLRRLPFTATISASYETWDKGQDKSITPPTESVDIEKEMGGQSNTSGSMETFTKLRLDSELAKFNTDTALVFSSQAIDDHPAWSKDGRYLFLKNEGDWQKLDLQSIALEGGTWHDRTLGVDTGDAIVVPATEAEIAEYQLENLRDLNLDPRAVTLSNGTKIELPQSSLSTSLDITPKNGETRQIWSSSMENCYRPIPAPGEEYFVYICELNGIFLMQL